MNDAKCFGFADATFEVHQRKTGYFDKEKNSSHEPRQSLPLNVSVGEVGPQAANAPQAPRALRQRLPLTGGTHPMLP